MRWSFNALLLSPAGTGMGTLMRGMLKGLSEAHGSDSWTVYLRAGFRGTASLPASPGIEYVELPGSRTLAGRLLIEMFTLPRFDRRHRIDVSYSPTILLPFTQKIPGVVTCVDFCCETVPSAYSPARRLSRTLRFENSLFRAAGVATISDTVRTQLTARYGARLTMPVVVTSCGVEDDYFRPGDADHSTVEGRPGPGALNILSSGGTNLRKDMRTLIRAYLLLQEPLRSRVRLMIMGPCDARATERIMAEVPAELRSGVRFLGYVSHRDKLALLSSAQMFAFPSLDEGFGLPVIEAMAARLPVVCTDLDVLREVGGATVLYFPKQKADQLACRIAAALQGPRRTDLIEAAQERARSFTWAASARRLVDLMRQVSARVENESERPGV